MFYNYIDIFEIAQVPLRFFVYKNPSMDFSDMLYIMCVRADTHISCCRPACLALRSRSERNTPPKAAHSGGRCILHRVACCRPLFMPRCRCYLSCPGIIPPHICEVGWVGNCDISQEYMVPLRLVTHLRNGRRPGTKFHTVVDQLLALAEELVTVSSAAFINVDTSVEGFGSTVTPTPPGITMPKP